MATGCTITRLSTTPIKGLALHHPDSVELDGQGAVGDRMFYLQDETGTIQSCKRHAALFGLSASYRASERHLQLSRDGEVLLEGHVEHGDEVETDVWGLRSIAAHVVADPRWGRFFSDLLGTPVQLVQAERSAHDVGPVSLLGTASVDRLTQEAGTTTPEEVDARRFRMLVEFASEEAHVEDGWDGRLLRVGEVLLRGGGPLKRCAATTRHPDTGAVDLQTLRMILGYRGRLDTVLGPGPTFGTYADVLEPGTVHVGDRIELLPQG